MGCSGTSVAGLEYTFNWNHGQLLCLGMNVGAELKAVSTTTRRLVNLRKEQRTCFNCFSSFSFSIWHAFIYGQNKGIWFSNESTWVVLWLLLTQLSVTCSEAPAVKHWYSSHATEDSHVLDFSDLCWFYLKTPKWSLESGIFSNRYSNLLKR